MKSQYDVVVMGDTALLRYGRTYGHGLFLVEIQAVVICNLVEPGLKRYRRGIAVHVLIALDKDFLDGILSLIFIVKKTFTVHIDLPLKLLNHRAKLLYVTLLNLLDNLLNMVRHWIG